MNTAMGLLDAFGATTELEIEVHGMACRHCKRTVERVVEGLDAVRSATVTLDDRSARVRLDREVEPARLVERIQQAGFDARRTSGST